MPFDPTLDELSSEQQRQMTHWPEQPNPARPYLEAAKNFAAPIFDPGAHGGILGMLEGTGYSPPEWAKAPQAVLNNPAAVTALGIMGGTRGFGELAMRGGSRLPLESLEAAKQMHAKGLPGVRQATDWHMEGPSGRWNKEIFDNPSTLNELKIPSTRYYLPTETSVGTVLNHPYLYNVYPHLKDMPLVFKYHPDSNLHGGFLNPGLTPKYPNGAIFIFNPDKKTFPLTKSFMLHELQHAVDFYEGRPLRIPSSVKNEDDYWKWIEEVRARNTQFRAGYTPEQLKKPSMDPERTQLQMYHPVKESEIIP